MKKQKTIYLSDSIFSSLDGRCDLVSIIEKGKISDLITLSNKIYCLSGAVGTGTGTGWQSMNAYEAISLTKIIKEKKYRCVMEIILEMWMPATGRGVMMDYCCNSNLKILY